MGNRSFRLTAGALIAAAALFLFLNGASGLGPGTPAPEFKGGPWLNSEPLALEKLRGKVVLVDMWTFG